MNSKKGQVYSVCILQFSCFTKYNCMQLKHKQTNCKHRLNIKSEVNVFLFDLFLSFFLIKTNKLHFRFIIYNFTMQWEPENCGIHVNLVLLGHAIKLHFVTFNNYKNKMIKKIKYIFFTSLETIQAYCLK